VDGAGARRVNSVALRCAVSQRKYEDPIVRLPSEASPQLGHHPRPLQENGTRCSRAQPSHQNRATPPSNTASRRCRDKARRLLNPLTERR
jgi:hypothetical protein